MSNVIVPNFALGVANDSRQAFWKTSRAMKAAGWITKASSDGTTKDTTGTYANDKWNGTAGSGNTGAAASITTSSGGAVTLTGLTGFASATAAQRWITISGAASGANNGTFKIITFISATSVVIFNPTGVAPDGNNGAISWTENIPLSDTYTNPGGNSVSSWIVMQGPSTLKIPIATLPFGATVVNTLGTLQTGSTASFSSSAPLFYNNLPIVTGLSNMTFGSVGRVLNISGAATGANDGYFVIVGYVSNSSVIIANPSATYNDANNGSFTWTEINTVPFVRGENVTQTTSGAQGELIGVNFDQTLGSGYLVVQPRFFGSGGGALGWDSSDNITGGTSGAVVAASGAPVEFVREVVFWAGSAATTNMTGYMQTINNTTENASRFSVLAGSAGATATIAPGGGGTANGFPAPGSYVWVGTGGSKADGRTFLTTWTGSLTNIQIMCTDATYTSGRSADGSFVLAAGTPTNAGSYIGMAFQRLDDQEDGDVDPYVILSPSNDLAYVPTRTTYTTSITSAGEGFNLSSTGTSTLAFNNFFRGWRRRGFGDAFDAFQNFQPGVLCNGTTGTAGTAIGIQYPTVNSAIASVSSTALFMQNTTDPEYVATAQDTWSAGAANAVLVTEPLWVISTQYQQKAYKGTCRWIRALPIPASASVTPPDTLGNKSWIVLSLANIPLAAGPWDGTTVPVH